MKDQTLKLAQKRRSIYHLGNQVNVSPDEITSLIKATPSAFNSQTTRAVITFGAAHELVWEIVQTSLQEKAPTDTDFAQVNSKLKAFKKAFGTILYFTDMDTVHKLEKQFPSYAANFYDWSEQAIGNANFAVWTALAENDLGANLQHYNPLIDEEIQQTFNLPASWKLRAEMPFGSIEAPAEAKEFIADHQRFKVINH